MFKGRKAQITVFMIVGIILLFSSALIVYVKNQVVAGLPADFQPVIEEAPMEAQPIKIFVENCVYEVTKRALMHAGAHGGWVDASDEYYGRKFVAGIKPTNSAALRMTDSSNLPYWYFMSSPDTCTENCAFDSNMPPLTRDLGVDSIQEQVEKYIVRYLDSTCLLGFREFRNQGYDITVAVPQPEVSFNQNDVSVLVNMPVTATREGRSVEVRQYFTRLDVKFRHVYDYARAIIEQEMSNQFTERTILSMIGMYSKPVSMDRLPPMEHYTFTPGDYYLWTRTETQERLESYVYPNLNMMQIVQSKNFRRNVLMEPNGDYDALSTGMLDKMHIYLNTTDDYYDLEARFSYQDWWPTYLDINGKEVIKPKSIGPVLVQPLSDLLGFNQYANGYSISLPVLVTLADTAAFNLEGFRFYVAYEGNIRYNYPYTGAVALEPSGLTDSYFCQHLNAGPYTINTFDASNRSALDHVRIEFVAGEESCTLGFTSLNGSVSEFTGMFPVGVGEIKLSKEDYLATRELFGAFLGDNASFEFGLIPIYMVNATARPFDLVYDGKGKYSHPVGAVSTFTPSDIIVMTFTRIADDGLGEFDTFFSYNVTQGPQEMMLVPGKYSVEGYVMSVKGHVIPAEEKTVKVLFKDNVHIVLNESKFNPWTRGGVVFNNVSGYWVVTADDIRNNRFLQFRLLTFPLPTTHSREIGTGPDLDQLNQVEMYTAMYAADLEPVWKNTLD